MLEKAKQYLHEYKITIILVFVGLCASLYSFLAPKVFTKNEASDPPEAPSAVITVDVSGAVDSPGVYELPAGSRVADALSSGGGLSEAADVRWFARNLNLARVLEDSDKIYVLFEWEESESTSVVLPNTSANALETSSYDKNTLSASSESSMVDVNTASLTQLKSLSGIGEVYAERIIKNRPFSNISEMSDKASIPYSTLQRISSEITF